MSEFFCELFEVGRQRCECDEQCSSCEWWQENKLNEPKKQD